MNKLNAGTAFFHSAACCGIPALFQYYHLDEESIPPALFLYKVESMDGWPAFLHEGQSIIEWYGTLLTGSALPLDSAGYLVLNQENFTVDLSSTSMLKDLLSL